MARSKDLTNILKRIDRLEKAPRQRIMKVLEKRADEVIAAQKAAVPVESGDLRDSIRKEAGDTPLSIVITAGGDQTTVPARAGHGEYDYALAQEFGTSEMDANPFFYGMWRLLKKRMQGSVAREGRKVLREAIGK